MEMHWVLTLQWEVVDGTRTWFSYGTTNVLPGETRCTLMARLIADIGDATAVPTGSAAVIFFDLAPNKLNGE